MKMVIQMVEETCYKCGITFGITQGFRDDLVKCKNTFYCPMGHPQGYAGKTEAEKQKEKAERFERWYKDERERKICAERSNSALRGVVTRMKKR